MKKLLTTLIIFLLLVVTAHGQERSRPGTPLYGGSETRIGPPRIGDRQLDTIPHAQQGPTLRNTREYEAGANRARELFDRSQEGRNYQRYGYRPPVYQNYQPPFPPHITYLSPYAYLGVRPHINVVVIHETVVYKEARVEDIYYLDAPFAVLKTAKTVEQAFVSREVALLGGVLGTEIRIFKASRYEYSLKAADYLALTEDAFTETTCFKVTGIGRRGDNFILHIRHEYSRRATELDYVVSKDGTVLEVYLKK